MKIYFGYAVKTRLEYTIAEVEAVYNEELNTYELCKPIFYNAANSTLTIEPRQLDVITDYDCFQEDDVLISLDREKVEQFVKTAYDKQIARFREMEEKGIKRVSYE